MTYLESRTHELRKRRLMMVDGALTMNTKTAEGGASVRVNEAGSGVRLPWVRIAGLHFS